MKFLTVVWLGIVAISDGLSGHSSIVSGNGGRIVGGQPAVEGQFPYQILLLNYRASGRATICGGAIISKTVIVTAAHCVEGAIARDLKIVAGVLDVQELSGHEQLVPVSRIAIHKNYNYPSKLANDIALLFLNPEDALELNEWVQPVALPKQNQDTTEEVVVSGWGDTSSGSQAPYDVLRWVQLPIVDDEVCAVVYNNEEFSHFLPNMICAGFYHGGKDSCQGDSGGPLVTVTTKYLAGIVSWGRECAEPKYPGVYTEVSHFIGWINATVAAINP